MKTRITDLFGIQHPIIQGGAYDVGYAEPAASRGPDPGASRRSARRRIKRLA